MIPEIIYGGGLFEATALFISPTITRNVRSQELAAKIEEEKRTQERWAEVPPFFLEVVCMSWEAVYNIHTYIYTEGHTCTNQMT